MSSALKVVFLLQRPEAWGNVASVWAKMVSDARFSPAVMLLPYNIRDVRMSAERAVLHRELLVQHDVPFLEWEPGARLESGEFDVAIFTHPYDRERPEAFWFAQVRGRVGKVIYIPYGLTVGAGAKNIRLQFAQPLQVGADLVVARSPGEKSMYAKYCPRGDDHVQVLGHPRFDSLLQALKSIDVTELRARIGGRTAILWNSHFSFGHSYSQSANFSTFDLLGPEIFEFFAGNRERLCLVWRPHPGLFPALVEQKLVRLEQLPQLRTELREIGVVLDEAPSHLQSFVCSDALLSDAGSFLFDYLAVQRPQLTLLNPEGEPLNEEARALVFASGSATDMTAVRRFIEVVVQRRVDAKQLVGLRETFLPMADGGSGDRLCEAILSASAITFTAGGQEVFRSSGLANGVEELCSIPLQSGDDKVIMSFPVLTALIAGLRRIRAEKKSQWRCRIVMRRWFNWMRTLIGEAIKQRPLLMVVIGRLRGTWT